MKILEEKFIEALKSEGAKEMAGKSNVLLTPYGRDKTVGLYEGQFPASRPFWRTSKSNGGLKTKSGSIPGTGEFPLFSNARRTVQLWMDY